MGPSLPPTARANRSPKRIYNQTDHNRHAARTRIALKMPIVISGLRNIDDPASSITPEITDARKVSRLLLPEMLELREFPTQQGYGARLVVHERVNRKRQKNR
jgi:hypothetical protein